MADSLRAACESAVISAAHVLLGLSVISFLISAVSHIGIVSNIRPEMRFRVMLFPILVPLWSGALTERGLAFRRDYALSLWAFLLFGGVGLFLLTGVDCPAPPDAMPAVDR